MDFFTKSMAQSLSIDDKIDIDKVEDEEIPENVICLSDQNDKIKRNSIVELSKENIILNKHIEKKSKFKFIQRKIFEKIAKSRLFNNFNIIIILANVILLAANRYDQSEAESYIQMKLNLFFTYYFLVEITIKLIGIGPTKYFRSNFYIFDGILVVVSLIEIILVNTIGFDSGPIFITIFRSLRLFRLAKKWKPLRKLLLILFDTLKDLRNFAILLMLFIFVASLFGMEFFAYRARFNHDESVASNS